VGVSGDRSAAQGVARGRWFRLAAFAAAAVGGLFGAAMLWYQLTYHQFADVQAYYDAATRLNEGEPLYPPAQDVNQNTAYFYPPLFAILFRPLALLPFPVATAIWAGIVFASFVATLFVLGIRRRATWLAVGILGAPIGFVLGVAQAHALVTLLLATASPVGVALAGQLKLFPILAGAWWVGRRDWRSVGWLIGWSAGLVLVQFVLEPQASLDFLRALGPGWVGEVRNLSPYALSPVLWAVIIGALGLSALRWAGSSAGWPLAVAFATLAPPRLLVYMLMSLLAAVAVVGGPKAHRPSRPGGDVTRGDPVAGGPATAEPGPGSPVGPVASP
jgi:hypothetical protein